MEITEHAAPVRVAHIVVTLQELRVLVHRLSAEGTFLHHQAEELLPPEHEDMSEEMAEKLRRFHDRRRWTNDA